MLPPVYVTPAARILAFPPVWSGCELVFRMYRIGFAGATDAVTPSNEGLAHPYAERYCAQFRPTQGVNGTGRANRSLVSCLTVARSRSVSCAVPESTSKTPSRPTDTTMLVPPGSGIM